MLTKCILITIFHYIHISASLPKYVVHLKLTECYMSIIYQFKKRKKPLGADPTRLGRGLAVDVRL